MTLFALGGKWVGFGASGLLKEGDRPWALKAERATAPNPLAHHLSMSRRLVGRLRKFWQCIFGYSWR